MFRTFKKIIVPVLIAAGAISVCFSATPKKKPQTIIEFTGTFIDNKSLKEHADSLAAFLPKADRMTVHNNVKSGYSLITTDGKIYKLDFGTVEALWNDLKNARGKSPLRTLKIHGMGLKLGADSLEITGFEDAK